jgi:hypothetical protein
MFCYSSIYIVANDEPLWNEPKLDDFRPTIQDKIDEQYQLKEVPKGDIKEIDIDRDYERKEFIEEVESKFNCKIGRSFYESKGELDDISEQKQIVFMDEVITVPMYNNMEDFMACYYNNHVEIKEILYLKYHLLETKSTLQR